MVSLSTSVGSLQTAENLRALGLQVFPARYAHEDKSPIVKWKDYQSKRVTAADVTRWFSNQKLNYWILCGKLSGVLVIDCDSPAADAWWRERLGDELMDSTAQVQSRKGRHYWFRIPDARRERLARPVQSWSSHPIGKRKGDPLEPGEVSFDFRAERGGVLAPPSVHQSGVVYGWAVPFSEIKEAPESLLDGRFRLEDPNRREGVASGDAGGRDGTDQGVAVAVGAGGTMRSLLSALLANPPAEGGRNDWLSRVAGHYAKAHRDQEDLYRTQCAIANGLLDPPLDAEEFTKTCDSIWEGEHERHEERGTAETSGWLLGAGRELRVQVRKADPITGEPVYFTESCSNFNLAVVGVMETPSGEDAQYWVKIMRENATEVYDAVLSGRTLGDASALSKWLASRRLILSIPDSASPRMATATRLQKYLEAQEPTPIVVTNRLGWNDSVLQGRGGFLTHEAVLTADEQLPFSEVQLRPSLALQSSGVAPFHYGFDGSWKSAQAVLRELLTFHHDEVTSVFGAWWAACWLKPQFHEAASLFPFMAIEAPSGSGKSTGFFPMMVQLNGSQRTQTIPTVAAFRTMAAAHSNGILWADDLDRPDRLHEILRAATAQGSLSKMTEDASGGWSATADSQIVAPVVLTGEALGLGNQKALLDRALLLNATSPSDRMSLRDPSRPQWDDITALARRYPDLSVLAGWFVQFALRNAANTLEAFERNSGKGRFAHKLAVAVAGAHLLDAMVATSPEETEAAWAGEGGHTRRVVAWTGVRKKSYNALDNALTVEMLPWALSRFQFPDRPRESGRPDAPHCPVFVKGMKGRGSGQLGAEPVEVWFSASLLSEAWERYRRSALERVHSLSSIREQIRAIGLTEADRKRVRLAPAEDGAPTRGTCSLWYYRLPPELAERVLERAEQ